MKKLKTQRKEHTSKKIQVLTKIYLALILVMFSVVVYDSFVHALPFYYILFLIAGLIFGRLISSLSKFYIKEDEKILTFQSTSLGIIVIILLLVIRFTVGKIILKQFDIIWTADAIYLFFIGVYYAKVKNMVRQIDIQVYQKFFGE